MKKAIPIIVLTNVLMILGIVGFLLGTGRLDKEKALTVLDLLKHKGSPDKLREQTYEILEHGPATAPATGSTTAPAASEHEPAGSGLDQLTVGRRAMEAERLKLESEAQSLRERQELLLKLQVDVREKLAKLEQERKDFAQQTQVVASKAREDAFTKALALYNELKPKQVKEIFMGLPPDGATELVSEYLLAMESERAGKIIAEFKTTEERVFITGVLERIRTTTPPGVRDANPNAARGVLSGAQARS